MKVRSLMQSHGFWFVVLLSVLIRFCIWSARSIGDTIPYGSRIIHPFAGNILESWKRAVQTSANRRTMCGIDRYGQYALVIKQSLAQLQLTAPGGPLEGHKAITKPPLCGEAGKSCFGVLPNVSSKRVNNPRSEGSIDRADHIWFALFNLITYSRSAEKWDGEWTLFVYRQTETARYRFRTF